MSVFTLADLEAATSAKYESIEIPLPSGGVVTLTPALRLPKQKRGELSALQDSRPGDEGAEDAGGDDESAGDELVDYIKTFLSIVANSEGGIQEVFAAIGDDPAKLQELFMTYLNATQPGEASTSDS